MRSSSYQTTIESLLEKLGVNKGLRSKEDDQRIRAAVFEAAAAETLAFISENLAPDKKAAFEQDLTSKPQNLRELHDLVASYLAMIPNAPAELEKRLKKLESEVLTRILGEMKKQGLIQEGRN